MSDFNPHSTATKGIEWLPTTSPSFVLDSNTKTATMSVLQTTSQVIANEKVYVGAIPTRGGVYALEVYDNETAVPSNVTSIDYSPNEDVLSYPGGVFQWTKFTGFATTNLYQNIDDNPPTATPISVGGGNDFIYCGFNAGTLSFGATQQDYYGRVGSAAALTGKRILGIEIIVYAYAEGPAGYLNVDLAYGNPFAGGSIYFGGTNPGRLLTNNWAAYSFPWLYNPATNRPWTIADIQTFDSTNSFILHGTSLDNASSPRVDAVIFRVYYCDENRIAVGSLDDWSSLLTPNAWNTVPVLTPTGGAWTKDGSGRHLYLLRRLSSYGAIVVPALSSGTEPNPARSFSPTLETTYGYVTAMGSATPAVFGLTQRTSAPADSVDSQPYTLITSASVYNGQTAQQEFSSAAALSYQEVRFLAKPNSATGDLLVKVKKRSDNTQLGQTITWTAAEVALLPDAGNGWKLLTRQMATGGTLATATQYYIEFSDATDTSTTPWSVLTLDVGDASTGVSAGFGGTTDRATVNGAEADRYDIPATVATVPTVPAGLTVLQQDQTLGEDCIECEVPIIEYFHISWTATSLSTNFLRYDLDRSEDGGTTWVNIAQVITEATVAFNDYESLRGVQACYRIRSVRVDGAASVWSASVCGTASAQNCEMVFVSNDDPTLNVAYQWPKQNDYDFLDSTETVFQQIYGRDYQVAFTPTERRGVKFDVPLVVSALSAPGIEGVEAFDALRAISVADVPYVCVLDHYGHRFYAHLQVPKGQRSEPAKYYIAQITVTEVQGEPTALEVA